MNIDSKKKIIRQEFFSNSGIVGLSTIGAIGLVMIYFSGIFKCKDLEMLYKCISNGGIMLIIGLFFVIVFLYFWILFFLNIILPPKKEILYLYKNEKEEIFFVDKKGRKYIYNFDKNYLEENNYYNVLKTHNYVYEVNEKTNANWIPKEKKSYWLNFYSPMGNYEDIFLLPIVYVILIIGLLGIIMSNGFYKFIGIIFSIVLLYVILYDLIYKNKLKQNNYKEIDETSFNKSYELMTSTFLCIVASFLSIGIIYFYFKLANLTSKLVFLPFLFGGLFAAGKIFAKAFSDFQLERLFLKGYIFIFIIFWFGGIIYWIVKTVIIEGNFSAIIMIIPFLIAGIFLIFKFFKAD